MQFTNLLIALTSAASLVAAIPAAADTADVKNDLVARQAEDAREIMNLLAKRQSQVCIVCCGITPKQDCRPFGCSTVC